MKIMASAHRFEAEINEFLRVRIEKLSGDILRGVPVEAYKERCAELRAFTEIQAKLPELLKKAKD